MRRLLAIFAIALAGLAAAPIQAQEERQEITVLLDWHINPDHGPLYVAQELGYFREAGLEVEFIEPADPNDPPRLVAAGRGDIAVSYQPQLHMMAEREIPVIRIGTLVATPLTSLVVLRDGPIRSIADLRGKRIGYSVGGFETAVLGAMLREHGLTLDDVELVNVNFSLSPSLMAGQVDAVIGAYRNFELNQMDINERPGRAFFPEEHGVPPYDELVLLTRRGREGEPAMRRFVDAVERGTQYLVNYPERAWELFIKDRDELDDELNRRAWRDTIPRFALRPAALDRARYLRFADFMRAQGVVESQPALSTYAVELEPLQ